MRQKSEVTILIVDDEAPLRKALVFDFKRLGFKVLDAANGEAAFDLIKRNQVDVVLSDVRMPDGDGVELLDRIKEHNPMMPVVMFITGFADISLEEAFDRGADAVFAKPFDRRELIAAVIKATAAKDELLGDRASELSEADFEIDRRFPGLSVAISEKTLSVGRGGIFVALQGDLPLLGAAAKFRIRFEQGRPLRIEGNGIVRWVRNQGCGIEFMYLNDDCRKEIIDLLVGMRPKAFIPRGS